MAFIVVLGSENYFGVHLIHELVSSGFVVLACDSDKEQFHLLRKTGRESVDRMSFTPEDVRLVFKITDSRLSFLETDKVYLNSLIQYSL